MKRLALIAAIILAGCLPILGAGMDLILPVEGVGTVSVPADATTIIVSASSSTGNMSLDQEAVRTTMERAIEALKAAGVKDYEITREDSAALSSASSRSTICHTVNNITICDNSSLQATALDRSAMVKLNSTEKARIDELLDAAESAGARAYVAGYGLFNSSAAESQPGRRLWPMPGPMRRRLLPLRDCVWARFWTSLIMGILKRFMAACSDRPART